jgi:hypothetical protein
MSSTLSDFELNICIEKKSKPIRASQTKIAPFFIDFSLRAKRLF